MYIDMNDDDSSEALNILTYNFYYDWLELIALNIFKWVNVPKTVDVRFMEQTLFDSGKCAFFNEKELGYLALPVSGISKFDQYGLPLKYQAFSPYNSYINKDLDSGNSVLIFNNYLQKSSKNVVTMFANKLANLSRTIDVNVNAQRTPITIACDKKSELTFRNIIKDYKGNKPFIFLNNNLNLDKIKVLDTRAPFVADKLQMQLRNTMNDFLTHFGVENGNSEKKERMTPEEVASNYGVVEKGRNIYHSTRLEACDKINVMFPLEQPMRVEYNTELITLINQNMNTLVGGGEGE